jgi:hypothetical protein
VFARHLLPSAPTQRRWGPVRLQHTRLERREASCLVG